MRKAISLLLALHLCAGLFATTPPVDGGHGSLKILSYNIYMLPKFAKKTGQDQRAKAIVDAFKNSDYDVIVFQEAFLKKVRDTIFEGLKGTFPYQSGEPIKGGVTLFNSGVWILSKLELKNRTDKLYRECDGIDCFSKKGATLVEVEKDGHTFQIVGTHLQADQGDAKQKARNEQYYDLGKLLGEVHKDGVPQIVAGDFNTLFTDTANYNYMLKTLKVEDGPLSGQQKYSWDNTQNDITRGAKDTSQVLLDYIFTRNNGFEFISERRMIVMPRVRWSCTNNDLSDHFAVEGLFEY